MFRKIVSILSNILYLFCSQLFGVAFTTCLGAQLPQWFPIQESVTLVSVSNPIATSFFAVGFAVPLDLLSFVLAELWSFLLLGDNQILRGLIR